MQQSLAKGFKPLHLKVFLSNKFAYAQVVRMTDGHIVASASTIEEALRPEARTSGVDRAACGRVGSELASRAKAAGIEGVHWSRKKGQKYHGRIAALIEALRGGGVPLV